MGAKQSSQMATAKTLVMVMGQTPYAAAEQVGLTRAAIYMSTWYKEWRDAKNAEK